MATLGHRPDINEELGDEKHEMQQKRARKEQLAHEIRPSWWHRLGRRLKRRKAPGSDG